MANARQWSLELSKAHANNEMILRTIVQKIAMEALRRVVLKSPVDEGRFRGNWFVSFSGNGGEETEIRDPSGAGSIGRGSAVIAGYLTTSSWPVITIYNNLPYANRIENGWSTQAPAGVVDITVAELRTMLG